MERVLSASRYLPRRLVLGGARGSASLGRFDAALAQGFEAQTRGQLREAMAAFRDAQKAYSPLVRALASNAEALLALRMPSTGSGAPAESFAAGECRPGASVLGHWAGDGLSYPCRVQSVDTDAGVCTVAWDDGADTHRTMPIAAVTTMQGEVYELVREARPEEVRAWAAQRTMQRALEEWKSQADAGVAQDAFVDLAGLCCDASFVEARAVLTSCVPSSPVDAWSTWLATGLERARLHLQRARWASERAYAPDARALAAVCLHRAEVARLGAAAAPGSAKDVQRTLSEVLSLHQRAADHLAAAKWSQAHAGLNLAVWRPPWGRMPPEAIQELLWAKACATAAAWQAPNVRRARAACPAAPRCSAHSRRPFRRPASGRATAWAPPEKLVPQQVGLPDLRGPVRETCMARAAVQHAWRALCAAAGEPTAGAKALFGKADAAAEALRLGRMVRDDRTASRLLLEVSVLCFTMGCRLGRSGWASRFAATIAVEAAQRSAEESAAGAADDSPAAARHTAALLLGRGSGAPEAASSQRRAAVFAPLAAEAAELAAPGGDVALALQPRRRQWRVDGYLPLQELWILRLGRRRRGYLAAPPPLTWSLEGIALSESAPEFRGPQAESQNLGLQ